MRCWAHLSDMGLNRAWLAVQAFLKSVELLVDLASLQTAFLTLDEAIKTTNRRVNALDNVVRPRLENTISYIKARPLRLLYVVLGCTPGASLRAAIRWCKLCLCVRPEAPQSRCNGVSFDY